MIIIKKCWNYKKSCEKGKYIFLHKQYSNNILKFISKYRIVNDK